MKTGYLAFIDVLGFRNGVVSHNSAQYIENYKEVLNQVVHFKMVQKANLLDYIVFSDSIVITSKTDEYGDFEAIVAACSRLLFSLTLRHIPIRGSISHGLFERETIGNSENIFLAGPALVEAYDFESRQNWLGIALCPSVNERHFDILEKCIWEKSTLDSNPLFRLLRKWNEIPLNLDDGTEDHIDGFIVFPKPSDSMEIRKGVIFMKALNKMRVATINPNIRKKYDNTIHAFKEIFEYYPNAMEAP